MAASGRAALDPRARPPGRLDARADRRLPRGRGDQPGHAVHAHLRPVGLDHVGPRDRAPRPRHRGRPVLEAAADPLHHAVLGLRGRRGALPLADRRPRRRAARVRDDLPGGAPPDRRRLVRRARRGVRRAGAVLELQVRARRGARQLGGAARGARALGVRAPPRRAPRPRALPRPSPERCCGRRSGRSSASTGSGCGSPSRGCARRLVVLGALVPALWFLPEWWGSGDPFRAGRAREQPEPGQRRVRRAPGARAGQPLPQGRDRAGEGRASSSASSTPS